MLDTKVWKQRERDRFAAYCAPLIFISGEVNGNGID